MTHLLRLGAPNDKSQLNGCKDQNKVSRNLINLCLVKDNPTVMDINHYWVEPEPRSDGHG
jgi:hypothetical protein